MPTETVKRQTLFTEDLDVILDTREWRDNSETEMPPRGSYYTYEEIAEALEAHGLTSALFESIEVFFESGYVFPAQATRTSHLYRVTASVDGELRRMWEEISTVRARKIDGTWGPA